MIRQYLPQNIEELIQWYERYISPLSLIAGFLIDNFIVLKRVDAPFGNMLMLSYLVLVGIAIVLLNLIESGRVEQRFLLTVSPFLPVAVQFFFGALFSGYVSLYSRSAGVAVSWVFVFALAFMLIGNERFRMLYQKLPFQISMYFTTLFSFFIFFLPLIFKTIGPAMFLLAGASSVVIIGLFTGLLRALTPERFTAAQSTTTRSLAALFMLFNVLYFSNIIPPLPLALKEGGVYHLVERTENEYTLSGEMKSFGVRYLGIPAHIALNDGDNAYVFTAVFAPSGLSTILRHQWQFYNKGTRQWETRGDVRFEIRGGRDGGFRGYSQKQNPEPGSWRVNVLTERGQFIGRINFTVVRDTVINLLQETR